jgi:hypothetical protein
MDELDLAIRDLLLAEGRDRDARARNCLELAAADPGDRELERTRYGLGIRG